MLAPKKILFLSRIHIKKGIENLIEAWSQIEINLRKNWIIEIVGNGEEAYIEVLQQKIMKHNLQEQIIIKPPVFGKDKIKLFREVSLFVLPTFSENFGIVVAESLASYTPVITTKGTPWEELNTCHAGWWIDIGVEPLKKALETLGYKDTYHFKDLIANPKKLMHWKELETKGTTDFDKLFDGFKATVDFPGYPYYKILMAQYPEAKVILTTRDVDKWYESTSKTTRAEY